MSLESENWWRSKMSPEVAEAVAHMEDLVDIFAEASDHPQGVRDSLETIRAALTAQPEDRTRAAFERWVSSPPFERPITRRGEQSAWPGNYSHEDVQLAWCAWMDPQPCG